LLTMTQTCTPYLLLVCCSPAMLVPLNCVCTGRQHSMQVTVTPSAMQCSELLSALSGALSTCCLPAGTDIYLNAFLIPLGVCIYTAHGGLRGTYIAAWAHVAVIYIALLTFAFLIYGERTSTAHGHTGTAHCLPACLPAACLP
jgi:hypothetical protein